MSGLTKAMAVMLGAGLAVVGIVIVASGGVELPTRQPPRQFVFAGLPLLLLGTSPLVAGATLLAIARGALPRESRVTQAAIVVTVAMLGLAFALADKR